MRPWRMPARCWLRSKQRQATDRRARDDPRTHQSPNNPHAAARATLIGSIDATVGQGTILACQEAGAARRGFTQGIIGFLIASKPCWAAFNAGRVAMPACRTFAPREGRFGHHPVEARKVRLNKRPILGGAQATANVRGEVIAATTPHECASAFVVSWRKSVVTNRPSRCHSVITVGRALKGGF